MDPPKLDKSLFPSVRHTIELFLRDSYFHKNGNEKIPLDEVYEDYLEWWKGTFRTEVNDLIPTLETFESSLTPEVVVDCYNFDSLTDQPIPTPRRTWIYDSKKLSQSFHE